MFQCSNHRSIELGFNCNEKEKIQSQREKEPSERKLVSCFQRWIYWLLFLNVTMTWKNSIGGKMRIRVQSMMKTSSGNNILLLLIFSDFGQSRPDDEERFSSEETLATSEFLVETFYFGKLHWTLTYTSSEKSTCVLVMHQRETQTSRQLGFHLR